MRIIVIIAILAMLWSSCATPRMVERRIRKHPDRYVSVINALKEAAEGGDTIAMKLADIIAPPPDTVRVVQVGTVVTERVDTAVVMVTDTVAVPVRASLDTVVRHGDLSLHLTHHDDTVSVRVLTYPVVEKTRTVTVTRDSIVTVPKVTYVGIRAPDKTKARGGPSWVVPLAIGMFIGAFLWALLTGRRS
ncbi:MAG: hypothetical protein D6790_00845 [Caldilineae bacterium]|nr:MAG: hypothetical protein D6790_00845 [Caldilineae bacterium]